MNHRTAIAVLALLVAMPACSFRQEYPDTKRYAFEVRRDGESREPAPDTRLVVATFDVSRRYEGEQMVYRLADGTWDQDFYHRFIIAPAELITEETSRWFSDARVTESVVDSSSFVESTHVIEGTLTTLLGDYSGQDGPHAVLELQLFGIGRDEDGSTRIIAAAGYEKRIPVPDRTSDALVTGWEQALREVFTDFEERIATAIAGERTEAAR